MQFDIANVVKKCKLDLGVKNWPRSAIADYKRDRDGKCSGRYLILFHIFTVSGIIKKLFTLL
jgi:hypothetical protein